MCIPPPASTESPVKHFFYGEVYNAARGLIFTRYYQYFLKLRVKLIKGVTEYVCVIKDLSSLEFERILGSFQVTKV